ncbi:MAG: hypothetical protein LQ347_002147, partial [Umbilicaria vellea]
MPPNLLPVPLARRALTQSKSAPRFTTAAYSQFAPARRRCLFERPRSNALVSSRRAFATTPWRRLADVNDSFDPRQQDRESDEVDVCIVGG